jgi:hypothetical protein
LALAGPGQERVPLVGGELEHWALALLFGVADPDLAVRKCHLDVSDSIDLQDNAKINRRPGTLRQAHSLAQDEP